jgi:putative phosphoribosyl transferase
LFESFRNKFQFQLRFKDRINAANILAAALSDRLNKNERIATCVLGIPRGGVIVADIVATKLQTSNFNIIVPRKLIIPDNEEIAFGAIMLDGTTYFNDELEVPPSYIEIEKTKQIQEIKRRMQLYLNRDNMDYLNDSEIDKNSTVVLVDDGVASGATFIVVVRWLRKLYNPRRIVIAATVAPKETVDLLRREVDDIEVITKPRLSQFHFVGQYYQHFLPVTDEEVIRITKLRNLINT